MPVEVEAGGCKAITNGMSFIPVRKSLHINDKAHSCSICNIVAPQKLQGGSNLALGCYLDTNAVRDCGAVLAALGAGPVVVDRFVNHRHQLPDLVTHFSCSLHDMRM